MAAVFYPAAEQRDITEYSISIRTNKGNQQQIPYRLMLKTKKLIFWYSFYGLTRKNMLFWGKILGIIRKKQ